MTIIKNLIRKNKLRNELDEIEYTLQKSGYYSKERQLSQLTHKPDAYGDLYMKINREYGILLAQRSALNKQLSNLSGINLFKKQPDEYIK